MEDKEFKERLGEIEMECKTAVELGEPLLLDKSYIPVIRELISRYESLCGADRKSAEDIAFEYVEKLHEQGYLATGTLPNERTTAMAMLAALLRPHLGAAPQEQDYPGLGTVPNNATSGTIAPQLDDRKIESAAKEIVGKLDKVYSNDENLFANIIRKHLAEPQPNGVVKGGR